MRIHYLQHVPFEGPAAIEAMLLAGGHTLRGSRLYAGEALPALDQFDGLLVMGGPMGVHDIKAHPWLQAERALIRQAIHAGRAVLGICLGAQLMAAALGARVARGDCSEIGWYPVTTAPTIAGTWLAPLMPTQFPAFHWHRDRFEIPGGAVALGHSEACPAQGFLYGARALALQFHLEITPPAVSALIEHCGAELDGSRWVQEPAAMLDEAPAFDKAQRLLARLLEALFRNE